MQQSNSIWYILQRNKMKTHLYIKVCTIVQNSTIHKITKWKGPKCPSTNEWVSKLLYILQRNTVRWERCSTYVCYGVDESSKYGKEKKLLTAGDDSTCLQSHHLGEASFSYTVTYMPAWAMRSCLYQKPKQTEGKREKYTEGSG